MTTKIEKQWEGYVEAISEHRRLAELLKKKILETRRPPSDTAQVDGLIYALLERGAKIDEYARTLICEAFEKRYGG